MHKEICRNFHALENFFRMRRDEKRAKKILNNFHNGLDSEEIGIHMGTIREKRLALGGKKTVSVLRQSPQTVV